MIHPLQPDDSLSSTRFFATPKRTAFAQRLLSPPDDFSQHELPFAEVHSPHMQAFAESLKIDIAGAKNFFKDLSEGGRHPVNLDAFVVGCIKSKGKTSRVLGLGLVIIRG